MIYTNEIIKKKNDRKRKIKKAIKYMLSPIFIAIMLLVIYIGYSIFIKQNTNISIFGIRQYIVMTGSMEPNYNIGDMIVIRKADKEKIKVNDVITFTIGESNETVSHRVIEIENLDGQLYYRTKGDNNNSPDTDLVAYSQVQGKVLFKVNKVGIVITQFTTRAGMAMVILVVAMSYMYSSRKEERRIAREDTRRRYNIPKYEKEETI